MGKCFIASICSDVFILTKSFSVVSIILLSVSISSNCFFMLSMSFVSKLWWSGYWHSVALLVSCTFSISGMGFAIPATTSMCCMCCSVVVVPSMFVGCPY